MMAVLQAFLVALIVAAHGLPPAAAEVVNNANDGGKAAEGGKEGGKEGGGEGKDPSLQAFSHKFKLKTRVFNAFPVANVTAFVVFEEDRVSRLHYGDLSIINATMEPHSDFIIQFRQAPRDCESRE